MDGKSGVSRGFDVSAQSTGVPPDWFGSKIFSKAISFKDIWVVPLHDPSVPLCLRGLSFHEVEPSKSFEVRDQ